MFVETVEINVQNVVRQQMPLILFGSVWIATENIIQNAHVVGKLKKVPLDLVKSAIPAIK